MAGRNRPTTSTATGRTRPTIEAIVPSPIHEQQPDLNTVAWSPVRSKYPAEDDQTPDRKNAKLSPTRVREKPQPDMRISRMGRSAHRKLSLRDGQLAAQTRARGYPAQACPPCPCSPSDKETNANVRHNTRAACARPGAGKSSAGSASTSARLWKRLMRVRPGCGMRHGVSNRAAFWGLHFSD